MRTKSAIAFKKLILYALYSDLIGAIRRKLLCDRALVSPATTASVRNPLLFIS
ncbi:hypothetical protein AB0756_39005 [Tolypothrix campylonemoides VB511288_2]|uniref:Uncharacterized protein n=1 Tax=Tolypothrix campylonemoides VB511288_2 TaxID=3232311 RepID=A0ABW8XMF1_9CYAN